MGLALTLNVGFTAVGIVAAVCYVVPVLAVRARRLRGRRDAMSEMSPVVS